MMEMAALEAYRPRSLKKPAAFATNSSASASIYSVRSHSSTSSRRTMPTSTLKSLSPFWRKKEHRHSLASSLASTQEETPQELEKRPTPIQTNLPELPPTQPLPLTDETEDFDAVLEASVKELKNDFTSGAREMADASLGYLAHVTDIAACVATSWGEFWTMMVHAAKTLSNARPSMSAAISACLLRALEKIARTWNQEQANGSRGTSELARIAGGTFDEILRRRKEMSSRPGHIFAEWLQTYIEQIQPRPSSPAISSSGRDSPSSPSSPSKGGTTIRIMTLSNSSTIRTTLLHVLEAIPDLTINLTILESRPRCEGADMACQIIAGACDKNRLLIHIVPDCAVGTASNDIDVVLLGADRIFPTGDVSNKIGSLSAALCVKALNDKARVVIISDVDKIGATGPDEAVEKHPTSELTSAWTPASRNSLEDRHNFDVFSEWFENVPARLVDIYVTEMGILTTADVEKVGQEIRALDDYIFRRK